MGIEIFFANPAITANNNLLLDKSSIHGLGVFAKSAFKKGQLIELSPVILGDANDYELLKHTALHDYYFLLSYKNNPFALGLGFSSFYNHACPANAVYKINRHRQYIKITAGRNIEPGEEVTINYNGNPFDTSAVQFTPNPMAQ